MPRAFSAAAIPRIEVMPAAWNSRGGLVGLLLRSGLEVDGYGRLERSIVRFAGFARGPVRHHDLAPQRTVLRRDVERIEGQAGDARAL
jgi:hypothetical protein